MQYSTRMYKPSSVHQAVTKISLFQIGYPRSINKDLKNDQFFFPGERKEIPLEHITKA